MEHGSQIEARRPELAGSPEGINEAVALVSLTKLVEGVDKPTRQRVQDTAKRLLETLQQLKDGTGGEDIDEYARAFVKTLHLLTACLDESRLGEETDRESVRRLKQQAAEVASEEVLAAHIAALDPTNKIRQGAIATWVGLACVALAIASGGTLTAIAVAKKFSLDVTLKVAAGIAGEATLGIKGGQLLDDAVIGKQQQHHDSAAAKFTSPAYKISWLVAPEINDDLTIPPETKEGPSISL